MRLSKDVQSSQNNKCIHLKLVKYGRKQASIHMHVRNAVPVVWSSLRLTSTISWQPIVTKSTHTHDASRRASQLKKATVESNIKVQNLVCEDSPQRVSGL